MSVAHPEMGPRVVELMGPWIDLAARGAERAFAGSPIAQAIAPRELAVAAVTFYLGANLLTQLVPEQPEVERLLATVRGVAAMLGPPA